MIRRLHHAYLLYCLIETAKANDLALCLSETRVHGVTQCAKIEVTAEPCCSGAYGLLQLSAQEAARRRLQSNNAKRPALADHPDLSTLK